MSEGSECQPSKDLCILTGFREKGECSITGRTCLNINSLTLIQEVVAKALKKEIELPYRTISAINVLGGSMS